MWLTKGHWLTREIDFCKRLLTNWCQLSTVNLSANRGTRRTRSLWSLSVAHQGKLAHTRDWLAAAADVAPAAASRYSQHSIQAPHSGAKNWWNQCGKEPHQCGGCGVVGSVAVVWSQWWLIHEIHGHALPRIQKSSTHWGEVINLEWDAKSIRIIHIY